MAEVPAVAPLPVPGKPPDDPATAPAKKRKGKVSDSGEVSVAKKKLPTDPAPAAEVPVPKKQKLPTDPAPAAGAAVAKTNTFVRTSAVKGPISSGAVAAVAAAAAAKRSAVQALGSAAADAGTADPPVQEANAEPNKSNVKGSGKSTEVVNQRKTIVAPVAKKTTDARTSAAARTAVADADTTDPPLQDANADVQRTKQPNKSPLIVSSGTKRKRAVTNKQRFQPPMARKLSSPMMMRSPMMRLMVSPFVVRPTEVTGTCPTEVTGTCPTEVTGTCPTEVTGTQLREVTGTQPNGDSSQAQTNGDDLTVSPIDKGHSWSDWIAHTSTKQVNNEYDRYLHDDLFPPDEKSFDILSWWKMHASKYPTLAAMACDILAVTASTVPSESAFSISGRVINDHRTRLSGSTVEALLCFQDWLRTAGSSYLDIISIDSLSENTMLATGEW